MKLLKKEKTKLILNFQCEYIKMKMRMITVLVNILKKNRYNYHKNYKIKNKINLKKMN